MVKTTSLTTAAINALTTGDSSILYNNQTRDLVLYSGSIGFVESSIFNLEINNINGECLILKNNSSLTNYVNFNVSNQGQLNIITNGSSKIVNIQNHNGSSEGLSLGGTLITATATELNKLSGVTATTQELNYVDTTPGTAEASKALVVDANRDIANIRNLQTENLTVNGTLVTSSATELNYNDIATIGTAEPAKALVVDMNKDISGINSLSATEITGEIQTASQPNITSVGTLTSLSTNSLTLNGTQVTATATELNKLSGATFNVSDLNKLSGVTATTSELNYVDTAPGIAEASKALVVDANRDITNIRNLQTENLTVNGTLVTSSATELNYNDIATIGIAEPAKALVVDMNKDISGINSLSANELSATEITGEIQTASQPNITSVGTLTSLSTNGLTLNGTQVTATATELNTMDGITATTSELNKLHGVTATTNEINKLSGLTSSTNELNILTGVTATYTELNVLDGITATTSELNYVDISTQGTAEASKALILDSNRDITNIRNLTATNLTGIIQTASQPNITSVGTLTGLTLSGALNVTNNTESTSSLTGALIVTGGAGIGGALNVGGAISATGNITGTLATASQPSITSVGTLTGLTASGAVNITNNTASTSSSTGALRVTGGAGIGGALNVGGTISATGNITGTLATASQPNITSVGTLTSLSTNSLTLNGTVITSTASELNWLDLTTGAGTAEASKALVLDSNRDITNIRNLTATNLTGTLQTASQPNITSVGTLTGLTSSGAVNITNNTTSTSSSTGALRVTGGAGIGGALNVGGIISAGSASKIISTGDTLFSIIADNTSTNMWPTLDFIRKNGASGSEIFGGDDYNDWRIQNRVGNLLFTVANNSFSNTVLTLNQSAAASFSSNLTVSGALMIGDSTDTGRFISALDNTQATTTSRFIAFGRTNSGGNQSELSFYWVSSGSGENALRLGFHSNTSVVTIRNDNQVFRGNNSSSFNTTSDIRLKKDIITANLNNCYTNIKNLRLVNYKWIDNNLQLKITNNLDKHLLGWIAQEVEEIIPDAVITISNNNINDCKTLNLDVIYQNLFGCVQKLINDKENLEIEINQLKEKNTQLENTIQNILTRLSNLEN